MSRGGSEVKASAYLPRLSAEWNLDSPDALWREIDATCCFVDISGFTALSERLARRGRIGAEELTEVLNHVFSRMLEVAYSKGGALLKFGGDALLLAFTQGDHAVLAAQAAVAMRSTLREARTLPTSVGRVNLRMSVGIHSGSLHLFRVGGSHKELLITGPGASTTTRMEQIAEAGEIVVSPDGARRLPKSALGPEKGDGLLLKWRKVVDGGPGPASPREVSPAALEVSIPVALRRRLGHQRGESEHRLAGVCFVKFQGVDDLLSSEGPDSTADALHRVVDTVQRAADEESVTFLASDIDADGGKIILVSGVPAAQEDDEGRLLRVARSIVAEPLPLPVRVGANHGHVFAGDIGTEYRRTFTIMGDTVNLAARLMAAASPGDLYVTAGILQQARTAFETKPLEPFMVKGKAHPVQAYRVGAPIGAKSSGAGTLPFKGRNGEYSALVEMFKVASEGQGRVVVVEAERGAGKSRLISELLSSVGAPSVMVLQGEPHGGTVAYLPLREPLRRLFGIEARDPREAGRQLVDWMKQTSPSLAPLLPLLAPLADVDIEPTPESSAIALEFVRDRIADTLISALDVACATPLLLVAEDAHWFDDTTSDICARLAKAARARAWFICVTSRPGAGGFRPSEPDLTLDLTPLNEESARELIDAATEAAPLRPQECEGIVSRAGGNPLFLEELLRIVHDTHTPTLPDSLDGVAMREIDALPPGPRRVLLRASVLGRAFERDVLLRLIESDDLDAGPDPLAALQSQLVPYGPTKIRFRHAVLQEAGYQTLPFRSRLAMHRQAAEVIEAGSCRPAEVAALLSSHYVAAQDWKQTWKYARLAAETAKDDHAPAEAAAHLERAVGAARHLPEITDKRDLAALHAGLGATRELLGEYDLADDAYRLAIGTGSLDPHRHAELVDRRAYIRSEHQARLNAAIRQLHAARAQLTGPEVRSEDRLWIRALLAAREADVRKRQGRLEEAIECSKRAAEEAESSGNTRALALSLNVLDQCLFLMDHPAEATNFARALELYQSLGDHVSAAVILTNLAVAAFYNSQWDSAAAQLEHAIDAATKAGDVGNAAFAKFNLGDIRLNQGRWDEARSLLASARRTLEACDDRLMAALATTALGRVNVFLGETESGLALLESASAILDKIGSSAEQLESRARLAEAYLFSRNLEEACSYLEEARTLERTSSDTTFASLLDRLEISLAMGRGDMSSAQRLASVFLQKARESGADYEVLMLISLDNQFGQGEPEAESARLRERLGVRRLPIPVWL